MKLPLRWLSEYVNLDVTVDELVEKLMWRGFEVADVTDEMPGISNVVVCTVVSVEPHPDAKKLRVCRVDAGAEELVQIVTNSTRVDVGAQVPVALCGATLADGFKIERVNLRGVDSYGMFCGGKELGLCDADYEGASADEVLLFHEPHPNGQSVQEAFELDSVVLDIELTPNRADCQSIIGMCREVAAALGQTFVEPAIREVTGVGNACDYARVSIENTELCSRYCARVVTDLKIEPSPKWMQKKLRSVGMRPINNIVDITNLVLVEYGHPMHAFDLACVAEGNIIVRNAREGETVVTLDSKERSLSSDMLVIADPEKAVGIAGVMGGENSEITEQTRATLFESAVFKGSNIRATTKKLRHTTDSAARFIKGVEPVNALLALNRAIELVDELGAGRIVGGVIDVCHANIEQRTVTVDAEHIAAIIGEPISPEEMVELLAHINIDAQQDGGSLKVTVPYYRTDIEVGIEADWDIAEEVARLYGYYRIRPTLMRGDVFEGRISEEFAFDDSIKDAMVTLGAYEIYGYNFMSPSDISALRLTEGDDRLKAVKLVNPFGADQSLLRTTLMPTLLKNLALNYNRKTGHGRFFEVGNVHIDEGELPQERKKLGIACMLGGEDFFTLKGLVEQLLCTLRVDGVKYAAGGGEYFQPGQRAQIWHDGEVIGELGKIHPDLADYYAIGADAYVAELDVDCLLRHRSGYAKYKPLPRFPVVRRDIAVLVNEDTACGDIVDCMASADLGAVQIEDVALFDIYRGIGVAPGKKSMAFSFALRAEDHTLSDEEIHSAVKQVLDMLADRFGAKLR
ncbi:MAG: phenylalanine--tRNA ligase subunit beta [Clostridia bacterium]|nr:phenylalanine--tRNA ligase subunit beta [Clostridia bacterium]